MLFLASRKPRPALDYTFPSSRKTIAPLHNLGYNGAGLEDTSSAHCARLRRGSGRQRFTLAKLKTYALSGIDAVIERALANLGYHRHAGRIVINLVPADLRKDAGGFDLPIALGLLVATRQLRPEHLKDFATVGVLSGQRPAEPVTSHIEELFARVNTDDVDFGVESPDPCFKKWPATPASWKRPASAG